MTEHAGRVVWLIVLAISFVAGAPGLAEAETQTRGSDLAAPPNANFGCEKQYAFAGGPGNAQGDYDFINSGAADCSWYEVAKYGIVGDPHTGAVPADGTVTTITVLSGPSPAPLRATIFRLLVSEGSNGGQCCFFAGESPVFQPTPNGRTTVTVNLPVERNTDTRTGIITQDYVGISGVTQAGRTLPLRQTGSQNTLTGYTAGADTAGFMYPRLGSQPTDTGGSRHDSGIPGIEVTMQYTWESVPGQVVSPGPGNNPGPPQDPTPPPIISPPPLNRFPTVATNTAQVKKNQALVAVLCNGDVACEGQLALASGNAVAAKKRAKVVSYGKATYTVPAGGKATVKVKLNRAAKKLLRKHKTLKVVARLTPKGGAPTTSKLTLKR